MLDYKFWRKFNKAKDVDDPNFRDIDSLEKGFKIKSPRDSVVYNESLERAFRDKGKDYKFKNADYIMRYLYPFTNEHLASVFETINIENGRTLVVGSSGDQVLYSVLFGAKDITLIDGNPLSKLYTELKISAIKNLDFNNFKLCFSYENFLNPNYYAKISHDLSDESKMFWDNIILECGGDIGSTKEVLQNMMHLGIGVPEHLYVKNNADLCDYFTSEQSYERLKNNLQNVNIHYVDAELQDFVKNTTGQYDLIMLSNIVDYVEISDFSEVVEDIYNKRLKKDGFLQAAYFYNPEHVETRSQILANILTTKKSTSYIITAVNEQLLPRYSIDTLEEFINKSYSAYEASLVIKKNDNVM